jgi:hypothetical protein
MSCHRAYITLPNHIVAPCFGKFAFVGFDLLVGWFLLTLLRATNPGSAPHTSDRDAVSPPPSPSALFWCGWYLFNPFSVSISTRGSHDTVVLALVLGFALLFQHRHFMLAAAT